ncbi:hypothetical protein INR49_032889 [Caranx melampygus]|nr:hypothetical protein INR49_032889 [Caranx melampygus]
MKALCQNKKYSCVRGRSWTLWRELHGLEGQNRELRDKAESVEREIQYVKDLLIEVYKARSQRLKQDGSA